MKGAKLLAITTHDDHAATFLFCIKGIPEKYPQKWNGHDYNSMTISIRFFAVEKIEAKLRKLRLNCSPEIKSSLGRASRSIEAEEGEIYCESEFLSVGNITSYDDIRWG